MTDIFILYSQEDQVTLDMLKTHLVALERARPVKIWYDGMIEAGAEWQNEVQEALENAEIILLLVSADFIASDYLFEQVMVQALNRHQEGKVKTIPVIARPCLWKDTTLGSLSALPKDGKAISNEGWQNEDEPYLAIVEELLQIISPRKEVTPQAQREAKPIQYASTSPSSVTASPNLLAGNAKYIGIAALVLVLMGGIWMFTKNGKNTNKEIENKPQKMDASTVSHIYELYNLYIQKGEEELVGETRLDNYVMAREEFRTAIQVMKPASADTLKAHDGIVLCNRQIEKNPQGRIIDNEYISALKRFREYLMKGNTYFLKGYDLLSKKDTNKAKDIYYIAKHNYDDAIRAGGSTGVEVDLGHRGRAQCEEMIIAISNMKRNNNVRTNNPTSIADADKEVVSARSEAPAVTSNPKQPVRKKDLSVPVTNTKPIILPTLPPELLKYAKLNQINEQIRVSDSLTMKSRK